MGARPPEWHRGDNTKRTFDFVLVTVVWESYAVRRIIHHALAGLGISALATVAAASALAGSATPTVTTDNVVVAVSAPVTTRQVHSGSPASTLASTADNLRSDRSSRSSRRPALAATAAADAREKSLIRQYALVNAQQVVIQKKRAAAKAALAKKKQAAIAKRRAQATAAAKRAGYSPGTTDPRDIARQLMKNKYGWGKSEFSCFNNIIMRESMWKLTATNTSSGAYGIPQALPGRKMASAGSDWRTNPATQIRWGLTYVKDRYGTPCGAWGFKSSHGWY